MIDANQLRMSLILADVEFRFHYAYHWVHYWDRPDHQWHLEVRQECKEYGERALAAFEAGDTEEALRQLINAKALEGDFCGWLDYRVYNAPFELLKGSEK